MNKRTLYESIMKDVSKIIKNNLSENVEQDELIDSSKKEFIQSRYSKGVLNLSGVKFEDSEFIIKYYIDDYKSIEYIDLRGADTSKLKYLSFMSLTSLRLIYGIEDIDTSNLRSTRDMFNGCELLKKLNINTWDVSNVRDMSRMFYDCESLEELNISDWKVSNVRDMSYMFKCCKSFRYINGNWINLYNWDVSNVRDMSGMFYECESLKLVRIDIWDVSNIEHMNGMFSKCDLLHSLYINQTIYKHIKDMDAKWAGLCIKKIKQYYIWNDSKSEIDIPDSIADKYFDDLDTAYDVAYNFVRKYIGKPFKVIVHIEDNVNHETVETVDNRVERKIHSGRGDDWYRYV